jgi:uncharacterized protein (TIGR02246 family)
MKKRTQVLRVFAVVLVLVVFPQTAGAAGTANSQASAAEVAKVLAGIIAADNAGDLDGVISFYAEDAVLLPPNDGDVNGKAAIRARYEEGFRHFRFDIVFSSDEAQVFGEWAFIRGAIHGRTIPKGDEASRKINDKYIMVLHRQKDGWKIARLIWNGTDPLPKTSP